jgi:hypothetical protein
LLNFNWWQFAAPGQRFKVTGNGYEFAADVVHANGNVYDQILITGPLTTFRADAGQVVRASYIDLNNDIVQVEFSGAGTVTISLAGAAAPALPENYNQNVLYVKGHATITVDGADETSNLSVFSVGRVTALNAALFKDVAYDGVADIALVRIASPTNRFGGLRAANAGFWATTGDTGVDAPGVQFGGPANLHAISAREQATPLLRTGAIASRTIAGAVFENAVLIAGSDMAQTNQAPIQLGGAEVIYMGAGADSHGRVQPALANRGVYQRNGQDVTAAVVRRP